MLKENLSAPRSTSSKPSRRRLIGVRHQLVRRSRWSSSSEAGKGVYRLERYAIEPLPKDAVVDGNINNIEAVSDALKRAWKRLGTRNQATSRWRCPRRW